MVAPSEDFPDYLNGQTIRYLDIPRQNSQDLNGQSRNQSFITYCGQFGVFEV